MRYTINVKASAGHKVGAEYGVVEDFVPVSDSRALVTSGPSFQKLNAVSDVHYCAVGDELLITPISALRRGEYLRLGCFADGLIYSDGRSGPHQPHLSGGHLYWTNDAPEARIYRNGQLFMDHWGGVSEVGNPWVDGGHIYFEARESCVPAPHGWDVWRSDLNGENREKVADGANPCVYNGTLFYGSWNGRCFDIETMGV